MTWEPTSFSSSGVMALTVAWVPTGMKIGVSMVPWEVVREPSRAAHPGSFCISSKVMALFPYSRCLRDKHGIAVTEKAKAPAHRLGVGAQERFLAGEGAYQHKKGRLRE